MPIDLPSEESTQTIDIAILGAGICGLTMAQELERHGVKSWILIDKGRSVGGRLATRRVDGQKFDHGAQFFTVRSPIFQSSVDSWLQAGLVREWTKGFNQHFCRQDTHHSHAPIAQDGHSRFIGVGGMNQIAKHLGSKLRDDQLILNRKITRLTLADDAIFIQADDGFTVKARNLVITAPAPQALELIATIGDGHSFASIKQTLTSIVYDPCVALMGFFAAEELPLTELPIQSPTEVICFLADNHSKGLATSKAALTVHLAPEASRGMFTAHDAVIADFICHQLKQLFGLKKVSRPSTFDVQRWRYASPQTTLNEPYLEWQHGGKKGPRILFAGEAFGGPKIEGAFLSGHAAANRICSTT
jgi:predicted NAD/FAD-dependent oxidoreductase